MEREPRNGLNDRVFGRPAFRAGSRETHPTREGRLDIGGTEPRLQDKLRPVSVIELTGKPPQLTESEPGGRRPERRYWRTTSHRIDSLRSLNMGQSENLDVP